MVPHLLLPFFSPLHLQNVLVVPSLIEKLFFVGRFTSVNNVFVEFDPFGFSVKDLPTRIEILRCNSSSDLYHLQPSSTSTHTTLIAQASSADVWHQRLGDPGLNTMSRLCRSQDISFNNKATRICNVC